MKPEEFIDFAERLCEAPYQEAEKRSAISRSYYGAFHASLQSLPPAFAPTAAQTYSAHSHKSVIDALKTWGASLASGRTSAVEASRTLATLKCARQRADYHLDERVDQADVDLYVGKARRVVELVRLARKRYEQGSIQPA
jgi:uncharacterized protein (UPF0332 family)